MIPSACLLAALAASPAAADVKVQVTVHGVDGAIEKNVLASIELYTAAQQGDLPEGEALRLYQRAPRQAAKALEPFGYYRIVLGVLVIWWLS